MNTGLRFSPSATETDRAGAGEDQLRTALRACKAVHDDLFMHCLSNGVFNAWGQPFDCTAINNASLLAEMALRGKS